MHGDGNTYPYVGVQNPLSQKILNKLFNSMKICGEDSAKYRPDAQHRPFFNYVHLDLILMSQAGGLDGGADYFFCVAGPTVLSRDTF
jgi:hypothetical protein